MVSLDNTEAILPIRCSENIPLDMMQGVPAAKRHAIQTMFNRPRRDDEVSEVKQGQRPGKRRRWPSPVVPVRDLRRHREVTRS